MTCEYCGDPLCDGAGQYARRPAGGERDWDIYGLEGETNVERLKAITAELSGLRALRATYLGTDYEPVEAIVNGHAEWLYRKVER
jgi:hypothetical protein